MEGPISRNRVSRIHDRVERFLADDRPERLSELRDFKRRHPDFRSGRKQTKTQAGIDASVEDLIPVLHLQRARRGAPAPLETLQYRCWEIGFQTGIEVDAHRDFECVLHRWARQRTEEQDLDEDLPEPEELAKAVVRRLRPSRFWKLALGFVPIVAPIAARARWRFESRSRASSSPNGGRVMPMAVSFRPMPNSPSAPTR